MFYNCKSLKKLNLSNFDTNKVTDMSNIFFGCSSLTNLNISNFKINENTNTSDMFLHCPQLRKSHKIKQISGENCMCI